MFSMHGPLGRRTFLAGAAALASTPLIGRARAATWPDHPVRFIVPFTPGGTTDLLGRMMAQKLSEEYGQQFVVENKPGAGGNIGGDAVAKSPPDGYTFIVGTPGVHVINQYIYKSQPFDSIRDLAPVVPIARVPNLISVTPALPVKTFPELLAYAKANPGKLSFATAGAGGTGHVAGELLKSMAGIDLVHIPYKGSAPALTDVIGGRVEVSVDNLPAAQPFAEAGKIRPLAVTTAKRWPLLPDVPTVAESGVPGYEASAWFTIAAPAKTPKEIVDRINASVNRYFTDKDLVEKMRKLGAEPIGGTPEEFAKLIADENVKWKKTIDFAGLKPE